MKKRTLSVAFAAGGAIFGTVFGIAEAANVLEKRLSEKQKMSDKHLGLYLLMNQWVKLKQRGINLSQYFEKSGYSRIAIYGMSYVGEILIEELKETNTEVVYGIDRNAENIWIDNINILSLNDELEDVDAVVVTAITFFDEIESKLSEKLDCPIISLEDILYEV